jgi:hypothetical protein
MKKIKWKIFVDYSIFYLKKDSQNKSYIFNKKGQGMLGPLPLLMKCKLTNINNIITLYNREGEIIYQGINYVDCFYKKNSFWLFLHFTFDYFSHHFFEKARNRYKIGKLSTT